MLTEKKCNYGGKKVGLKQFIKARTIDRTAFYYDLACMKGGIKTEYVTQCALKAVKDIDPIKNFFEFREAITPFLGKKQFMTHWGMGSESLHYGHLKTLYDYAGMEEKPDRKIFPAMEHAVGYATLRDRSKDVFKSLCFIYQSKYMEEHIHKIDPLKPVFSIGPYIHYVKPIYSAEEERQLKKELGKTLVVFAGHLLETDTKEYSDVEFVDFVMQYAKDNGYDTVLVSVYFCDVNEKIYKDFESRGARLISAGFREDTNFIRRLRTIMNVADKVVTNCIGTPVGFCKYLGIPYQMFVKDMPQMPENELFDGNIDIEHHKECYKKLEYLSSKDTLNDKEQLVYDELYQFYSGASDIKTPEEIYAILSIGKEVYTRSKGVFAKYSDTIKQLLNQYQGSNELYYRILCDAIDYK